jgi:hypothetical protein
MRRMTNYLPPPAISRKLTSRLARHVSDQGQTFLCVHCDLPPAASLVSAARCQLVVWLARFTWRANCVRLYGGALSCESDCNDWDSHWCVKEGGSDVQEQSGRRPQMQRREGAWVFIGGG